MAITFSVLQRIGSHGSREYRTFEPEPLDQQVLEPTQGPTSTYAIYESSHLEPFGIKQVVAQKSGLIGFVPSNFSRMTELLALPGADRIEYKLVARNKATESNFVGTFSPPKRNAASSIRKKLYHLAAPVTDYEGVEISGPQGLVIKVSFDS